MDNDSLTSVVEQSLLEWQAGGDRGRRAIALWALPRLVGATWSPAVPVLLTHPEAAVRLKTIERALLHRPEWLFMSLSLMIADRDPTVRRAVWRALADCDEPATLTLARATRDHADVGVRVEAIRTINFIAGRAAIPFLIAALDDEAAAVRREALTWIGRDGDESTTAALTARQHDPDPRVRAAATRALAPIVTPSPPSFPLPRPIRPSPRSVFALWLRSMAGRREHVRARPTTLARPVPPDPVAGLTFSDLLATVGSPDWAIRWRAVRRLGQLRDPRASEVLVAALADPQREVARAASDGLGTLADPAVAARLFVLLGGDETPERARFGIRRALDRQEAVALAVLVAALSQDAATADDETGSASLAQLLAPTLSGLASALSNPQPLVRRGAAFALRRLAPTCPTPELIELLLHHKPAARRAAASALGKRRAGEATPRLVECLRDADSAVRRQTAWALAEIGPASSAGLELALNDGWFRVRRQAAWALARLADPAAAAALGRAAEHDPDRIVRRTATLALSRIGRRAEGGTQSD